MARGGRGAKEDLAKAGPPMPVRDILEAEIAAGETELGRPTRGLALSALSAGLDIGFGPLLIAVVLTNAGALPEIVRQILVANAYAVGFVLVVLGRSELFTEHTTLAALPVLDRRKGIGALGRLWGIVYAGNVVGAILSATLGGFVAVSLGVVDRSALDEMARVMVAHDWWTIALSGVLAGWLMGLSSWLLRASQETISQIAVIWVVTGAIGFAQLHHCIAGTVEVVMAITAGDAPIPMAKALTFLAWATVGNTVGGVVFVAALKLAHASRSGG